MNHYIKFGWKMIPHSQKMAIFSTPSCQTEFGGHIVRESP